MVIEVHLVRETGDKGVADAHNLLKKQLSYLGVSTEYDNHFFAIIPSAIIETVDDGFGEEVVIYSEDISTIKNIIALLNGAGLGFFIDKIKTKAGFPDVEISRKFEDLSAQRDMFNKVVDELTRKLNPTVIKDMYRVTMVTNDAIITVFRGDVSVFINIYAQSISPVYNIAKLASALLDNWELYFEFR